MPFCAAEVDEYSSLVPMQGGAQSTISEGPSRWFAQKAMSPLVASLVSLVAILVLGVLTVAAVARASGRRFSKRRQRIAALVFVFGLLCMLGYVYWWGTWPAG
jgi:hypothetical protein